MKQEQSMQQTPRAVRVLLVDDQSSMRQWLALLLEEVGSIQVVGEAANGREGFELTRQLQPDVVLMDIHMPVLDGIRATRLIHAECPTVRVIGLSSMPAEGEQAAAMREAGAVSYLPKDAPPDTLLAAIRGE